MTGEHSVYKSSRFLAVLLVTLVMGLPIAVWLDMRSLTDEALLTESNNVSEFIDNVRSFYADEIIERIKPDQGEVKFSHDFRNEHQSIPIPATFSKELAGLVGTSEKNIRYRFTSDFPFIGLGHDELNEFEKSALKAFRDGLRSEYIKTDGGIFDRRVQIASPVIMTQNCVSCHNKHPLSPKKDWQVGDVRGLQTVSAGRNIASSILAFKYLIAFFLLAGTTSILVLLTQQRQSKRISQVNIALEKSQTELKETLGRLEDDLDNARHFQELGLPQEFPKADALDCASYFVPARQVGGDFFDVFTLPSGKVGFVMADVSDKGVKAAFFAAVTRSVLVDIAIEENDPATTLTRVNERLCKQNPADLFVTILYGIIDVERDVLHFSNCAHQTPILRTSDGSVNALKVTPCIPVGIFPQVKPDQMHIPFTPGDTFCVFTDGVTDAGTHAGDPFGEGRIMKLLENQDLQNAQDMCDIIKAKQQSHAPDDQFDDAAFLAIKRI